MCDLRYVIDDYVEDDSEYNDNDDCKPPPQIQGLF